MRIGTQQLLIVLLIVLVIFGPTQLPKLVKSLKKTGKELSKAMEDDEVEEEEAPKPKKKKTSSKAKAEVEDEEEEEE